MIYPQKIFKPDKLKKTSIKLIHSNQHLSHLLPTKKRPEYREITHVKCLIDQLDQTDETDQPDQTKSLSKT